MKKCVVWVFGRGASIACNLTWTVPSEWKTKDRQELIRLIGDVLRIEMDRPEVDTTPYKQLLSKLANLTNQHWCHTFITTNWDFLLQREIECLSLTSLPAWLKNSHVYHLNGTIEELKDNSNRSPFLLETDSPEYRTKTIEAQVAFHHMILQQTFVVVGLSFRCKMDQAFLRAISSVQDDLHIGESDWIIVNSCRSDLREVARKVREKLPCTSICTVPLGFKEWQDKGMPQLQEKGILVK